jgi:hypothetical protein
MKMLTKKLLCNIISPFISMFLAGLCAPNFILAVFVFISSVLILGWIGGMLRVHFVARKSKALSVRTNILYGIAWAVVAAIAMYNVDGDYSSKVWFLAFVAPALVIAIGAVGFLFCVIYDISG